VFLAVSLDDSDSLAQFFAENADIMDGLDCPTAEVEVDQVMMNQVDDCRASFALGQIESSD
jgi:hypothetical protein